MHTTPSRVVIVHDYLTQRGGAERVVLDLLDAYPGATVVTSCYQADATYPEFAEHEVRTLWPDRLPFLARDPRRAFPFLAGAFDRVRIDADLVVCSSSGWSHRVRTDAPKIVYCHNPPRWLYQPHDYLHVVPAWLRRTFVAVTHGLRRSDVLAAQDADVYVANSTVVASRIAATYGRQARVLHPAAGLAADGARTPVEGLEPGFLLTVGRTRGYKNTEAVCRAVASLPDQRLVVVGGVPDGLEHPRITGLTDIDDATLRWLYANAAGLVAVAAEDFGLTVVEAQAFGTPTVTVRRGGYLDSTIEGLTGVFVDDDDAASVAEGIRELHRQRWNSEQIEAHAARFSRAAFRARIRDLGEEMLAAPAEVARFDSARVSHRASDRATATAPGSESFEAPLSA
ncbi:glycosyltransferase [Jatrophihabitans sp. YIM 134969]